MQQSVLDSSRERAELLANALRDTVAELRLIDPGDLIGYIRSKQWANIADLVQSSSELFFREGTLTFGCTADFSVDWATPPTIALDMEFQSNAVSAFFTLFLERVESLVELKTVWFATQPESAEDGTALLVRAIADARLPTAHVRYTDGS